MSDFRRQLPSIEQIMQSEKAGELEVIYGRQAVLEATRLTEENIRSGKMENNLNVDIDSILSQTAIILNKWFSPSLQPVINATGVIIHTNLGRAPLADSALKAIQRCSSGYCSLELDLVQGKRGTRNSHLEELLSLITGAESALVVNNNAAAVLLALHGLANRKRVIIARSQLIEIGGGFRIPDVMRQSGAKLLEVGATNRVHRADYEEALEQPAALIFYAHSSNFKITGFTAEPGVNEIVEVAHNHNTVVMADIGSGALLDTKRFGLSHEPMIQETIQAGVDLVAFSGDKLLGGPQAGILVGKTNLIEKLKKHPLYRAMRPDKSCLAALQATLIHYLKGDAEEKIPVWRMIASTPETIRKKVEEISAELGWGEVLPSFSTIGGGSLPGETLPTYLLAFHVKKPETMLKRLRLTTPPVIARIENDRVVFDLRTVLPGQKKSLREILAKETKLQ